MTRIHHKISYKKNSRIIMVPLKYFAVALFLVVIYREYDCQPINEFEESAQLSKNWLNDFAQFSESDYVNKTLKEVLNKAPTNLEFRHVIDDLLMEEGSSRVKSVKSYSAPGSSEINELDIKVIRESGETILLRLSSAAGVGVMKSRIKN